MTVVVASKMAMGHQVDSLGIGAYLASLSSSASTVSSYLGVPGRCLNGIKEQPHLEYTTHRGQTFYNFSPMMIGNFLVFMWAGELWDRRHSEWELSERHVRDARAEPDFVENLYSLTIHHSVFRNVIPLLTPYLQDEPSLVAKLPRAWSRYCLTRYEVDALLDCLCKI